MAGSADVLQGSESSMRLAYFPAKVRSPFQLPNQFIAEPLQYRLRRSQARFACRASAAKQLGCLITSAGAERGVRGLSGTVTVTFRPVVEDGQGHGAISLIAQLALNPAAATVTGSTMGAAGDHGTPRRV